MSEDNLLDSLLAAAADELEGPSKKDLTPKLRATNNKNEDEVFLGKISDLEKDKVCLGKISDLDKAGTNKKIISPKSKTLANLKGSSVVHSGDTDSSDDEENRDYESGKYNDYGKSIKRILVETQNSQPSNLRIETKYEIESKYGIESKHGIESNLQIKSNSQTDQMNLNIDLSHSDHTERTPNRSFSTWKTNPTPLQTKGELAVSQKSTDSSNSEVITDPFFGIRISKPLISSNMLKERMVGRQAVPLARLKYFIKNMKPEQDWVIAGVVVSKTIGKTSANGNQFSVWTLSDLLGEIKTASVFLFGNANKELWKTNVGTVVGILNPSVLEGKGNNEKGEGTLSVHTAQKVMIFGQSKDLGECRSTNKAGEKCRAIVNINKCEFCIYHVKKEYQKHSIGRSELQSSFAGKGLTALRNKVLGKNEVFYAGKSYTALPAKKSKKLVAKDEKRLASLSNMNVTVNVKPTVMSDNGVKKKQFAQRLDSSYCQKAKDLKLLEKLGVNKTSSLETSTVNPDNLSAQVSLEESKATALGVIAKLKQNKNDSNNTGNTPDINATTPSKTPIRNATTPNINTPTQNQNTPTHKKNTIAQTTLSPNINSSTQNINSSTQNINSPTQNTNTSLRNNGSTTPSTNKPSLANKLAGNLGFGIPLLSGLGNTSIDLNAPITTKHVDRAKINALKYVQRNGPIEKLNPNSTRGSGKKRALENNELQIDPKKQKLLENEFLSERFKKMIAATSKHTDLLEQRDQEEQEKYFDKLEKKEQMEEKMQSTFKVECKAVRCLKCKYTSFSASQLCKTEKHPLKVFDAFKRFFKCKSCGNRTCCLEIVPTYPCSNCNSGSWERTAMMKEKKVTKMHHLSIRGGEQTFINSHATDSNINLLVPE